MPELPEVETVMRGLQARLEGRTIVRAAITRPDMRFAFPPDLVAHLTQAHVTGFRRRGKYILMRLGNGWSVLMHLGMSGRILIAPAGANALVPHEHLVLETDDRWRVGFVDPRRFGSVDLVPTEAEDSHRLLAGMGPEPFGPDFTAEYLSDALAGKRTPIKAALLDQKVVAGLGNIYVSEALFRAGISPRRSAHTVPGTRAARLAPGDQGHAGRRDRRGRVEPARLRAARRRARLFPARLEGVRPRTRAVRALPRPAMPRHQPDHAVGTQHLPLPAHATISSAPGRPRRHREPSRSTGWRSRADRTFAALHIARRPPPSSRAAEGGVAIQGGSHLRRGPHRTPSPAVIASRRRRRGDPGRIAPSPRSPSHPAFRRHREPSRSTGWRPRADRTFAAIPIAPRLPPSSRAAEGGVAIQGGSHRPRRPHRTPSPAVIASRRRRRGDPGRIAPSPCSTSHPAPRRHREPPHLRRAPHRTPSPAVIASRRRRRGDPGRIAPSPRSPSRALPAVIASRRTVAARHIARLPPSSRAAEGGVAIQGGSHLRRGPHRTPSPAVSTIRPWALKPTAPAPAAVPRCGHTPTSPHSRRRTPRPRTHTPPSPAPTMPDPSATAPPRPADPSGR